MNQSIAKFGINCITANLLAIFIAIAYQSKLNASEMSDSIARLNYAGFRDRSHCTATLVSKNAVITAKHCLRAKHTALFGYTKVTWAESRKMQSKSSHSDKDLAVICLTESSQQVPIELATQTNPKKDMAISLFGYGASNPHILSEKSCRVSQATPKTYLDCPLEKGMSGGPALITVDGKAKLIGVISATSNNYSIIEPLDNWVLSTINSCE